MSAAHEAAWWRSVGREPWKALAAAQVGWMLDAMDVMLYAFALTEIQREFSLSSGAAGGLASVTLLAGAFGNICIALTIGAVLLTLIPIALQYFGSAWNVERELPTVVVASLRDTTSESLRDSPTKGSPV